MTLHPHSFIPAFSSPVFSPPDFSSPDNSSPDFSFPHFHPRIFIPTFSSPDFSSPAFSSPHFHPRIFTPAFSFPAFFTPSLSSPHFHEIEKTKNPEMKCHSAVITRIASTFYVYQYSFMITVDQKQSLAKLFVTWWFRSFVHVIRDICLFLIE